MTASNVGFGDENLDGIEFWRLGFGRWRSLASAGQQGGDTTCGQGNGQYDDTCSFHTLTLTMT